MSFWDLFESRYTRDLKAEVFRLRAALAEADARLRQRELDLQLEHDKQFKRLEGMIEFERTQQANLIARADTEAVNSELLFRSQIADLKKAHAEELNRVIEESQRLRNENERFRLHYSPVDRTTQETESSPRPSSETTFGEMVVAGTPWQRILAREIAKQMAEPIARNVPENPANEVKTDANG